MRFGRGIAPFGGAVVRAATGVALGAILIASTTSVFAQQGPQATITLRGANGEELGTATFAEEGGGVRVVVQGRNMPPGEHGIHFHEFGRCDPPMFMSAGEHYNPTGAQHGLNNPAGPHAGDLPNLYIGPNGEGTLEQMVDRPAALLDSDGAALVIHAAADDYRTDPSGGSGARIACGVLRSS